MTLLSRKSNRKGFEDYTDIFLAWKHDGKLYAVRVRPVFGCDTKKLLASAINVEDGETFEKYL